MRSLGITEKTLPEDLNQEEQANEEKALRYLAELLVDQFIAKKAKGEIENESNSLCQSFE